MREHAATLLPVFGFVAMLVLVFVDVGMATGRSTAQAHAQARRYGRALAQGDGAAAEALHVAVDPAVLDARLDAAGGASFWVQDVIQEPNAVVTVLVWDPPLPGPDGRKNAALRLAWVRGPDGWRIEP